MVYEHMWQQHTNSPDSKWCDAKGCATSGIERKHLEQQPKGSASNMPHRPKLPLSPVTRKFYNVYKYFGILCSYKRRRVTT
jgi:hypothetical protein